MTPVCSLIDEAFSAGPRGVRHRRVHGLYADAVRQLYRSAANAEVLDEPEVRDDLLQWAESIEAVGCALLRSIDR